MNTFLRETIEILHRAGLAWWGVHRVRHLLDYLEQGGLNPAPLFWDVVEVSDSGELRAEGRCDFGSHLLLRGREDHGFLMIRTCGGHFVARLEGIGWVADGLPSEFSWADAQEDRPDTDWAERVARRIRRLEAAEAAVEQQDAARTAAEK